MKEYVKSVGKIIVAVVWFIVEFSVLPWGVATGLSLVIPTLPIEWAYVGIVAGLASFEVKLKIDKQSGIMAMLLVLLANISGKMGDEKK